MKTLDWIGTVALILGIVSLVVPIPGNQWAGFKTGGVSVGIKARRDSDEPPLVSSVMILGGVSTMVAGKMKR